MIDQGVLTWNLERFFDCSSCDDSNTDITSVFSYKQQDGKYYREELKSGTYSSYFDRILYEPNEQGGFTKVVFLNLSLSEAIFKNYTINIPTFLLLSKNLKSKQKVYLLLS